MLLVAAFAFFVAVLRGLRAPETTAPRRQVPTAGAADRPDNRNDAAAPSLLVDLRLSVAALGER
jgi:hypothetical protein